MALVNLSDIYPEVRPDVPDCMDVIMLNAIRKAAIKFCEKSHFWEVEVDPISMIQDIAEYDIEQPANQRIIQISQVIGTNGQIHPVTEADMDAQSSTWRTASGSSPNRWLMVNPRLMRVYPTPKVSGEFLSVKAIVKPSPTATVIDDYIYDDFYEGIGAGAKALLCAMPEKTWTNLKMVPYYQEIFNESVSSAKMRRASGFSGAKLQVRHRPFGG